MTKIVCYLASAVLLFSGCKSDTKPDPEPVINSENYYPLQQGDFLIYQVTETRVLGENGTPDVTTFKIREQVDSLFNDLSGEPYYRVIRSFQDSASTSWTEDSVLIVKRTTRGIERQENNFRQIKLASPIYLNRTWNPNLINPQDSETWKYSEVNVPYTLSRPTGDTTFQNTIRVLQAEESNQVDVDQRWEQYAAQVGMIESYHYTEFRTQDPLSGVYTLQQSFKREEKLLRKGNL